MPPQQYDWDLTYALHELCLYYEVVAKVGFQLGQKIY